MNKIKAIETEYNGLKFRSRLEARWAVFLDAVGIKYLYEPEGFEFEDGTRYLPDFYLPDSHQFLEVKGVQTERDWHKVDCLIDEGQDVVVGFSDMSFRAWNWDWGPLEGPKVLRYSNEDESYLVRCAKCGKYYFMAELGTYECRACGHYDGNATFELEVLSGDRRYDKCFPNYLKDAVKKAKQARFEHGECVVPDRKEEDDDE